MVKDGLYHDADGLFTILKYPNRSYLRKSLVNVEILSNLNADKITSHSEYERLTPAELTWW